MFCIPVDSYALENKINLTLQAVLEAVVLDLNELAEHGLQMPDGVPWCYDGFCFTACGLGVYANESGFPCCNLDASSDPYCRMSSTSVLPR